MSEQLYPIPLEHGDQQVVAAHLQNVYPIHIIYLYNTYTIHVVHLQNIFATSLVHLQVVAAHGMQFHARKLLFIVVGVPEDFAFGTHLECLPFCIYAAYLRACALVAQWYVYVCDTHTHTNTAHTHTHTYTQTQTHSTCTYLPQSIHAHMLDLCKSKIDKDIHTLRMESTGPRSKEARRWCIS